MSVLIKGMEMPRCCGKCSCVEISKYLHLCGVTGNSLDDQWDARNPDCPLVEVPTPHGRLIDADKLESKIKSITKEWNTSIPLNVVYRVIADRPIIIEAEE